MDARDDRKWEFTKAEGGAAFTVKVVTRTTSTELVGIGEDGSIKVRLTASSAGDPAANTELIELLASKLGVPSSMIEVVAGAGGRDKLISVKGISTADVEARLGIEEN